jgi:hypothetical protein
MKWLTNFKNKECKTIFGKIIQKLLFHNITRILLFAIIALIGALCNDIVLIIGVAGLGIHIIIMIIYAWIINPINSKKK